MGLMFIIFWSGVTNESNLSLCQRTDSIEIRRNLIVLLSVVLEFSDFNSVFDWFGFVSDWLMFLFDRIELKKERLCGNVLCCKRCRKTSFWRVSTFVNQLVSTDVDIFIVCWTKNVFHYFKDGRPFCGSICVDWLFVV